MDPSHPKPSNPSRWEDLTSAKLARLLDVDALGKPARDTAVLPAQDAAMLQHQLAAPLLPDLLTVPGAEKDRLRQLVDEHPGARSFADHLTCLDPSQELLDAIKHFARHVREDTANSLQGMPADVLYFAAIAAALLRCDTRISKLSDAELREGFAWASEQPGADAVRLIFRDAAQKLSV